MTYLLALQWTLITAIGIGGAQTTATVTPVVEAEQNVYTYTPANNGAGPMWCAGSTCIVRTGTEVFASGLETLKDFKPLNNCRWLLFQNTPAGWQLIQKDAKDRTREPCPLACFPDGPLFLSVNPTLADPKEYGGPARPEILQLDIANPTGPFKALLPDWKAAPPFTEHSYRSFAADGPNRELILMQNIGYTHSRWVYRNAQGEWAASGKLAWPFGAEYDRPQPIRVCYPTVMLKNRAVYFCGVSDIMEPYLKWREFKFKLTNRHWDYDFRRLFYTWSDDIATGKFHKWIEIASRDKTGGHIFPCDLWVAPDGRVHLLWTERALDERLRQKFFPQAKQSHALNYAIVRDGKVIYRRSLVFSEEGGSSNLIASAARFHITPGNHLFVLYYVSGKDADGKRVAENRLVRLRNDGTATPPITVPLRHPMTSFFTATVRAGCRPSKYIDMLGIRQGSRATISYARIRLDETRN